MKQKTPLAGVIGWPINHTRSPRMHDFWLKRYQIPGHYVPLAVSSEGLEEALRAMALLGFRGVNVTLPHKERVLELASSVSETARRIGAANTLTFREDGSFHAENTDAYGFSQNILQQFPDWKPDAGPALVIGAGGASRAIVQALIDARVPEIRIANRTQSRAEALASHFGPCVSAIGWSDLARGVDGAVTVVNATSMGMNGNTPLTVDLHGACPEAIIADIIYEPLRTPFLEGAAAQGFRTVDGLGMLLHQGRHGFESWFGEAPVVDEDLRVYVMG
ncbi:MAG: shikimate dehydrogenase [Pseudomonadota bacterium]